MLEVVTLRKRVVKSYILNETSITIQFKNPEYEILHIEDTIEPTSKEETLKILEAVDSAILSKLFSVIGKINVNNNLDVYIISVEDNIQLYSCEPRKREYILPIPEYMLIRQSNYEIYRRTIFDYEIAIGDSGLLFSPFNKFEEVIDDEFSGFEDTNKWITLIEYNIQNWNYYLTLYPQRKLIRGDKVTLFYRNERVEFSIRDRNTLVVRDISNGEETRVYWRKAKRATIAVPGLTLNGVSHITVIINNSKYVFYKIKDAWMLTNEGSCQSFQTLSEWNIVRLFRSFLLYGYVISDGNSRYTDIYISTSRNQKYISSLKKFGKHYFTIMPIRKLLETDLMHASMLIESSNHKRNKFNLYRETPSPLHVFAKARGNKAEEIIMRASSAGNLVRTAVPFSTEYKLYSRIKQWIAKYVVDHRIDKKSSINLYFEKKASKADESAIRVFEEVMRRNPKSSENYFILDSSAKDYLALKQKYPDNIVKKHSLHHYILILLATHYISSELSNHVISDRVYMNRYRERIIETPLIFLQHGIMFAKPIDNPQAADFHKDNLKVNLVKTVISSELEAEEFYKVGYNPEDLLLSGLATFDFASLDDDANKIAYMPTYRYWEEHYVYSGRIEETTYYKDIIQIISLFSSAGLLDRLLIVPHNKFAQYVVNAFPEYENIVDGNPSNALRKSRVFITDYSSAIYDAIIRGAYPIFYWKDRDILIKEYHAIPPVNEFNAPGPIAFDESELIALVKHAIDTDFKLEQEYKDRYLRINKFNDRKNTERIVDYLIDSQIV